MNDRLWKLDIPWSQLSQHDGIWDIFEGKKDQIKAYESEVIFLTLFGGLLGSFAVHFMHLRSKVRALIQEITSQVEEFENFRKEVKEIKEGRQSIFFRKGNLQKRASKFLDVFTNLNAKINFLKPEIRPACVTLSEKSFHSRWPFGFDEWKWFRRPYYTSGLPDWKNFLMCIKEVRKKYANDDQDISILDDFRANLYSLHVLQQFILDHSNSIPADGVLSSSTAADGTPIVGVIIRAALLVCWFWGGQFDLSMKKGLITAISHLHRKSNITDPNSLDQLLRALEKIRSKDIERLAHCFVKHGLPFNRRFEKIKGRSSQNGEHLMPFKFTKKIESLMVCVVKNLKKGKRDYQFEQSFLLDFKLLISETENSFSCSLPGDGTLLLNFLAKAWLIETEVFIIEQLTAGHDFVLNVNQQIDALNQGVQQIKDLPEEHSEDVNRISMLIEEVAKLVPSLLHYYQAQEITEDIVQTMLLLLLLKILHFKLDRQLCDSRSSILPVKDRLQSFLEGLEFLMNCFINQQWRIIKDGVLDVAQIERMARRVINLYCSLLTHHMTEDTMENMNNRLSYVLDEIKVIMSKIREAYFHVPKSKFPRTNALGFFDSLLSKLRELLNYKADSFASVKQHIEEVLRHLELFRRLLGDIQEHEIQEIRDLSGNITDLAYEAANLVDSIMCALGGHGSECLNSIWLYYLLQDIRHTNMLVANVQEKKTCDVKVQNVPQISKHVVSSLRPEDVVPSLNDQQEEIIDRLVRGRPQRDTLSIVGMPGIGKTTLAKKVYTSPKVVHHFHVRAWCCVTEAYRKRELLLEILSHIIPLTENILGMSNDDLDSRLWQLLLKKRYLIFLDDMWKTEAWDDLQRSFPDDKNGSRILITSRLNDVALKAKVNSDPHHLRLLTDDESWDLLQMKIFHEKRCPEELIQAGLEIAKNCKGLPLAIVAVAGILERTGRQQNRWKEIAENLSSRLVDNPEVQCRDILELSYNHLPDHLRACFLYFGAFLEDQEIPVRKLIRLWIAEGFVQKTVSKSQEDLAEDYLKDLVGRSLVIFAQPRSRGGTKACRVHDMLRSLCQSKARKDNFLQVITRSTESDASDDDLDFAVDFDFSDSSNYKTYDGHRLCFYSKRHHFAESRPSGPCAHSLLFLAASDRYARSSYDISFICANFSILKVLDLECINMGPSFPSGIELMVLLRYLAVSGDFESVPSSIDKLENLETFIVKGLKGRVNLSDTFWCLKRLRHVHVSDVAVINLQDKKLGNSSLLEYLVSLSLLYLPYGEETNNILKKFPNLQKLGCMFSKSSDCSGIYNLFPRFDVLIQLESLKMSYHGRGCHNAEFSLPLSLKKLTLSNFRLPWSHISVIGRLQNLEVLKLLCRAYDGETWDMVDGEFCNLKFLKLDSLDIVKWNASSDNLPKLRQLVLRNCKYLEEVPSSFVESCTLQMIEVQWCGKYAEDSARRMIEQADEHLKVIITSDLDSCHLCRQKVEENVRV